MLLEMAYVELLLYGAADGVVSVLAGNRRFTGGIDCAVVPHAVSIADAAKHFRVGFVRCQDIEARRAAEFHLKVLLRECCRRMAYVIYARDLYPMDDPAPSHFHPLQAP